MKNKFLGSLLIALAFMINAMPAGQPVAGNTALHEMANKSNTQGIRDLVASGASVNATNANGDTPLHIAAESGRVNNVKALLEAGADFNIIGRFEHTPLHWAAINGHFECVQELVKAGSDITLQNRQNYTPAMLAALHGHQDIVVYFASLESLSSSSSASSSSSSPSISNRRQGNYFGPTFSFDDIFNPGRSASSPFNTIYGPFGVATQQRGSGQSASSLFGITNEFLESKSSNEFLESQRRLIPSSSSSSSSSSSNEKQDTDPEKHKAMLASQENTWTKTFEYCSELLPGNLAAELSHNKKDINLRHEGETPLNKCFSLLFVCGSSPFYVQKLNQCLNLLIEAGALVDLKNSAGQTALHKAAQLNLTESIKILLAAGAFIDTQDNNGCTPLCDAAKRGNVAAIELLIQRGASINTPNNEGKKPIDLASDFATKAFLQQITDIGNDAFNVITKDAKDDKCPICLEGYWAGSKCITLGCGHDFCELCIAASRTNGYDTCPVCRSTIIENKIKCRNVTIKQTVEAPSSSSSSSSRALSSSSSSSSDRKRKRDDQDDEEQAKKRHREEKREVTSDEKDSSDNEEQETEENSNCIIS